MYLLYYFIHTYVLQRDVKGSLECMLLHKQLVSYLHFTVYHKGDIPWLKQATQRAGAKSIYKTKYQDS